MKSGDVVLAAFKPLDTHNLTPQAERIVGQRFRWSATEVISEGHYVGQWRMELDEFDYSRTGGVLWAPLCDLTDITLEEGVVSRADVVTFHHCFEAQS